MFREAVYLRLEHPMAVNQVSGPPPPPSNDARVHPYVPLDPYMPSVQRWVIRGRERARRGSKKTSIDDIEAMPPNRSPAVSLRRTTNAPRLPERLEIIPGLISSTRPEHPSRRRSDSQVTSPRRGAHGAPPQRVLSAPSPGATVSTSLVATPVAPPSYGHAEGGLPEPDITAEVRDSPSGAPYVMESPVDMDASGTNEEIAGHRETQSVPGKSFKPARELAPRVYSQTRSKSQPIQEVSRDPSSPDSTLSDQARSDDVAVATPHSTPDIHQPLLLPRPPPVIPDRPVPVQSPGRNDSHSSYPESKSSTQASYKTAQSQPPQAHEKANQAQGDIVEPPVTTTEYLKAFIIDTLPRQLYMIVLLFFPRVYFSRVSTIFEDAALTLEQIKAAALQAGMVGSDLNDQMSAIVNLEPPEAYKRLEKTWETFVDNLLKEWKILNIVSALLLG